MGTPPGRIRTATAASGRCARKGRPRGCLHHERGPAAGFTLLELLIVVVLASILLAIGVPFFGEFGRNNRLTASANDFLAAAHLARTEAIKRQQTVSLCASANSDEGDGASCSGAQFTGWIVFPDPNGDCERAPTEAVLLTGRVDHPNVRSRANGSCVSFADNGFVRDGAPGVAANRLLFCDERGTGLQAGTDQTAARGILVVRAGRPALLRDPDQIAAWDLPCP